ncbi:phosphotransferase [Corynebacterium sp. TAE3-ERU16]|uniref:phosphotransferase n=1 Tax=Corynebacterium sp. TAE3-ERU16 TaxID=2849493 RepID=UPI00351D9E91
MNPAALAATLSTSRYYGAKSHPIDTVEVVAATEAAGGRWLVVRTPDGLYQMLVDDTDEALPDVLGTPEVATALGAAISEGRPAGGGTLHAVGGDTDGGPDGTREPGELAGVVMPRELRGRRISGEQSNTSLVFGDGSTEFLMVKYFRKLQPGVNPDVELLAGLSEVGCPNIAPLRGWVTIDVDGWEFTTAMVQDFARGAADGWELALEHAAEGRSFAEEARALGRAVRRVHGDLASAFDSATTGVDEVRDHLTGRLTELAGDVPVIGDYRDAAHAVYDGLDTTATTPVQRVHGDLHLGQVLRTDAGWLLIDFEGEPARPLEERRQPDSPLKDLAGVIRSFDYAAHFHAQSDSSAPGPEDPAAWARDCVDAFLEGYGTENTPLLEAYRLDKALYEVAYEANNRPGWLDIPLAAVKRLTGIS